MRICTHQGLVVSVFTRNEHCPPHVHVGNERWDARYRFSFWHGGVALWDVTPMRHCPGSALLEELRQVIEQPVNLRHARQCWWKSRRSVCMDHQHWDPHREEVVRPSVFRSHTIEIEWARYIPWRDRTLVQLAGQSSQLEIEL
ncbi:hypothetical protein RC52_14515 [Herbaspirillum rubrisubalbicans]|nr:hypothetical protein [Herbaspirillum rubrisubalbicans]